MKKIALYLILLFLTINLSGQTLGIIASAQSSSTLITELVSWYDCDEASGTIVDSKSAYNSSSNTGSYGGTYLEYDGSDYTTLSEVSAFAVASTSTISISTWIYFNSNITDDTNANLFGDYDGPQFYLKKNGATGEYYVQWYGTVAEWLGVWTPSMNVWYNIVFTKNGTTLSLYIDGVLQMASDTDATYTTVTPGVVTIGGNAQGETFLGRIKNIGYWNKTLSQSEVTELQTKTYPF
jgi:hypothetical protein